MLNLHRLLSISLAMAATAAVADDTQWKLEVSKDGIQVHSRAVEGWTLRETRGAVSLRAKLSSVVAVVTDLAAADRLNDVVESAAVHHRTSDTSYQIYSRMRMPWPLSNRDILNQRDIRQNPETRVVTITDVATQNVMPEQEGLVRIVKSRQEWTFTPKADGTVSIEARTLADPAGPIPSALINSMSSSMPLDTLRKVRELAVQRPYVDALIPYITELPR